MRDAVAYKVLLPNELAAFRENGSFAGAPNDLADGFIHMSTADQVDGTVSRYFAQIDDLFIAAIDLAALGDRVTWDVSSGGQRYPHFYGQLDVEHLIAVCRLTRDAGGKIELPCGVLSPGVG